MPRRANKFFDCNRLTFMRHFLFLTFGLMMFLPTAAKAESVWLILGVDETNEFSFDKIEMKDMSQCKEQGEIWRFSKMNKRTKYLCLKGK